MEELATAVGTVISRFNVRSLIDVLIITFIIYWALLFLRRTTAMALLRGIITIVILGFIISNLFQLTMVNWLLRNSFPALLVAIPILFQPELRRLLEQIGRGLRMWAVGTHVEGTGETVEAVTQACSVLSERRCGAIMVLERDTGLQEYIEGGVTIDAAPSKELVVGLFSLYSPLHDGAVILRRGRIVAARCVLPLSDNMSEASSLGMRHRAALGITERTDAISVVVSEETGHISLAVSGHMATNLDKNRLYNSLMNLYTPSSGFFRKGIVGKGDENP